MELLSVTYQIGSNEPHFVDFQTLVNEYIHKKISNSSYIIETKLSPTELYKEFIAGLNQADTLIISKFAKPWHGHGDSHVIDWLVERS